MRSIGPVQSGIAGGTSATVLCRILAATGSTCPGGRLNLTYPLTIEADGPSASSEIAPASMHAVYTYGQRGELAPLTLHWYQGNMKPDLFKENKIPQWANGVLFVGDKGMLLSDYSKYISSCLKKNSRTLKRLILLSQNH